MNIKENLILLKKIRAFEINTGYEEQYPFTDSEIDLFNKMCYKYDEGFAKDLIDCLEYRQKKFNLFRLRRHSKSVPKIPPTCWKNCTRNANEGCRGCEFYDGCND